MGFPLHYSPALRSLDVQSGDTATAANTSETDLFTYTLKGKSLAKNGKGVKITAWGKTGATANNKTIKLYFGGTVIYNTGAVAANNKDWWLEATVIRTGVGTQEVLVRGNFNATLIASITSALADETSDQTLKVTGTNGTAAAADITGSSWSVERFG